MMRKLFDRADEYVHCADWTDLALLKICLISFGILLGLQVEPKDKKPAIFVAAGAFFATCVPLLLKFVNICRFSQQEEWEEFTEEDLLNDE